MIYYNYQKWIVENIDLNKDWVDLIISLIELLIVLKCRNRKMLAFKRILS